MAKNELAYRTAVYQWWGIQQVPGLFVVHHIGGRKGVLKTLVEAGIPMLSTTHARQGDSPEEDLAIYSFCEDKYKMDKGFDAWQRLTNLLSYLKGKVIKPRYVWMSGETCRCEWRRR